MRLVRQTQFSYINRKCSLKFWFPTPILIASYFYHINRRLITFSLNEVEESLLIAKIENTLVLIEEINSTALTNRAIIAPSADKYIF